MSKVVEDNTFINFEEFLYSAIITYHKIRVKACNFARDIFDAADLNGNGTMELEEYLYLMRTLDKRYNFLELH